jgi:NAD(P)-dependent dehydrogenase (short-subunit alcohol dehydrogenase family)
MQEQMQKGVWVTGADAGLGLSLVKRFLQAGCAVFAGVHRSAVNLNSLAELSQAARF